MRIIWAPCIATALVIGCASARQHVTPLSAVDTKTVCIIDNPRVRASFLDAYKTALTQRGYGAQIVAADSPLGVCPLTSKYVAYWNWDIVLYMSSAQLNVYKDGRPAGQAIFDAAGSRFVNTEEKVRDLVNQLYPN